jgi:hypothetical protein
MLLIVHMADAEALAILWHDSHQHCSLSNEKALKLIESTYMSTRLERDALCQ